MNIILLTNEDFFAPDMVRLRNDRRVHHMRTVLAVKPGDLLKVGLLNDKLGQGRVIQVDADSIVLEVYLDTPPPSSANISLLLALPRPKVLRRILQSATTLGLKRMVLVNSYRVEKSYWQSPLLKKKALQEQLLLGLEQAVDTILPEILLRPRFKPFVEDELPKLAGHSVCLLADPTGSRPCPANCQTPAWLAIGPEGGFIPYEVEKLSQAGFRRIQFGQRILRVETAVSTLLGRLLTPPNSTF